MPTAVPSFLVHNWPLYGGWGCLAAKWNHVHLTEAPAECPPVVPQWWESCKPWVVSATAGECGVCGGLAIAGSQAGLWTALHANTAAHVLSWGRVLQPVQRGMWVCVCVAAGTFNFMEHLHAYVRPLCLTYWAPMYMCTDSFNVPALLLGLHMGVYRLF